MNDVSKLSGASPVSPTPDRVWKSPRKQRPDERSSGKRSGRQSKKKGDGAGVETPRADGIQGSENEENETQDQKEELLSYGSGGLKRPRSHKVNLVI